MKSITLTVNGHTCTADVSPTLRLLDFLRNHLYLTGAKEGCGEGECGACTVLMDGRAVLSCLVLAFQADGRQILTVEGLARTAVLDSPVHQGDAETQEPASEQAHADPQGHDPIQEAMPEPGNSGSLDPLQQAFIDHGAIQCGYCTPGMLLSAKGLLLATPAPTEQEIRTAISGNMCRCTGYIKIIEAVRSVAESHAPEKAEATHAPDTSPAEVPSFQPSTPPFGQKK